MKTQSTVRPEQFTINDLGKKREVKLCYNIEQTSNEEGDIIFVYDMELHTVSRDINSISALVNLKYDYNDELALLNKGIADSADIEYVAYRNYVAEIKNFIKGIE